MSMNESTAATETKGSLIDVTKNGTPGTDNEVPVHTVLEETAKEKELKTVQGAQKAEAANVVQAKEAAEPSKTALQEAKNLTAAKTEVEAIDPPATAGAKEFLSPEMAKTNNPDGVEASLTLDEKYALVRSVGEECIQEDELRNLLEKKKDPVAYDGFEPSGRMHIAQGVMKVINVNKMTKAGCIFKFWVADWFAQLNNKMGGDLKKIQTVGNYMIEIWKAVGMDMNRVEFVWTSEEINKRAGEYWPLVLDIARRNNLPRIKRCCQIMGRNDEDELTGAQIFYPCMQCADIFFLKADICQLGMDQRKVNVLAREYCTKTKRKLKPIILSHHMLPGLLEGQEKMSKSVSNSAIFMEDEESEVEAKINNGYCPLQVVAGNPIIEYSTYIVLPYFGKFVVNHNGKTSVYETADQLHQDYLNGALTPDDLKLALIKALNQILQPVRDHFKNNAEAKELLQKVKSYKVSR